MRGKKERKTDGDTERETEKERKKGGTSQRHIERQTERDNYKKTHTEERKTDMKERKKEGRARKQSQAVRLRLTFHDWELSYSTHHSKQESPKMTTGGERRCSGIDIGELKPRPTPARRSPMSVCGGAQGGGGSMPRPPTPTIYNSQSAYCIFADTSEHLSQPGLVRGGVGLRPTGEALLSLDPP